MANYVNVPDDVRIRRLIDVAFFEGDFSSDWPRNPEYIHSWQWQLNDPDEPKEPQPATEEALKKVLTLEVKKEGKECSICLMDFKKHEMVKSMPCNHIFHELCILTWLNLNNTCPFCRYRLPTKFP